MTGDLGAAERAAADLAARLPPESPIPWLELGHAMELAHRYDEALDLYDRAAAVAPLDNVGPKTGGLRAARWGETALALPRLEEALRRDPRDAETWHALGLVRLHEGDFEGRARRLRERARRGSTSAREPDWLGDARTSRGGRRRRTRRVRLHPRGTARVRRGIPGTRLVANGSRPTGRGARRARGGPEEGGRLSSRRSAAGTHRLPSGEAALTDP